MDTSRTAAIAASDRATVARHSVHVFTWIAAGALLLAASLSGQTEKVTRGYLFTFFYMWGSFQALQSGGITLMTALIGARKIDEIQGRLRVESPVTATAAPAALSKVELVDATFRYGDDDGASVGPSTSRSGEVSSCSCSATTAPARRRSRRR